MNPRSLFGVLALAVLGCNSTVGEGTKSVGSPQPFPSQALGTEARLTGPYVKTLQLAKGEDNLSLQLQAGGMSGVRQFELIAALEPAGAFNLTASSFAPAKPFITMGSGVQLTPEKTLRLGGAFLDASGYSGDGELGTLHLQARSSLSAATLARIRILYFSAGPSSSERDTYTEQELNLGLSVGP